MSDKQCNSRDAALLKQSILHLLEHTDELQLILRVREKDGERPIVCPSILEIFANRGIVELITKFLLCIQIQFYSMLAVYHHHNDTDSKVA